jgi:hypothetical protein
LRRSQLHDQPNLRSGTGTWCAGDAWRCGGIGLHNKRPEPDILLRHLSNVADKPVQAHSCSSLLRPSSLEQAENRPRMQCSELKETITPSPMARNYEVRTETLTGTARRTPVRPKSRNVTIWFCSWSQLGTTLLFATVTVKDPSALLSTIPQEGVRMAEYARSRIAFNITPICGNFSSRIRRRRLSC